MQDNPSGSVWHKWDLHVHTPASALAHSLGTNWDIYVERLIEAIARHDISAIATADYFSIDGFRELQRYYNSARKILSVNGKSANVLLIPGAELRLNIFNSEEESINIHIIFDPDKCSPDFIEQHFLEELRVNYRSGFHPLKTQALLAIGKSIATGNALAQGEDFSALPESEKKSYIKQALGKVTLDKRTLSEALKEIDDIFEKQKVPSRSYLVAVVGKGHGGISSLKWFEDNKGEAVFSRAGLIREDMTHQADIVFSNNPNDRDFYLGRNPSTSAEEVKQRFDRLKPCVWGSDAHTLDKLLHPSNGNTFDYTWIKADVTFEGLKQITFEPELRVRIQKEDPAEAEAYPRVGKCVISFPDDLQIKDKESAESIDFCLNGTYEVDFSNNLTCIVGGRGSGKSTLVHILYNSWSSRDSAKLIGINSPLTNLQLTSRDGLGEIRRLVRVNMPAQTEFYLQNEIEKFARDIQEMSALVRSRLERLSGLNNGKDLKSLENEWSESSIALSELIDAFEEVTDTRSRIKAIEQQIATLKQQTEVIKSKEYKDLQKDIQTNAKEVSDFGAYGREYKRIEGELVALEKSLSKLDWTKWSAQQSLDTLRGEIAKWKKILAQDYSAAKAKFDNKKFAEALATKKTELKKYLEEKGLSPENIGELADATQQINVLEADIRELRLQVAPSMDVYATRDEVLLEYSEQYTRYKNRFFEVSSELQKSLAGLKFSESQIEITFHPRTNDQLLKDSVAAFIKDNNDSKTILSDDNIESVLFREDATIVDHLFDNDRMRETVRSSPRATAHTQVIQEMFENEDFLEKLCLRVHRSKFDIANIQVQTKLGEKLLQNTSFGERCGIVIAIVLVAGTNPIVIDQPEDNLDGKFISRVLVHLLRKQKQNRQIILVTRDANLVIGGDSELIAILEGADAGRTEIIPATIENKKQRPNYIWALDGGEAAFKMREEKYNL